MSRIIAKNEEAVISKNGIPIYHYRNQYLHSSLYFSFEIQKKNILPAIKHVVSILNNLKHSITAEIALVLPEYTKNAEMVLDHNEDLNWNMAYERHIMNCAYTNIKERKDAYESITPNRLMQAARELFVPDNEPSH